MLEKWRRIPRLLRALILFLGSFAVVAFILLVYFWPQEFDESEPPPPTPLNYKVGFKWTDPIYHLYQAAVMPPREAMTLILQNTANLRVYMAMDLMFAATAGNPFRDAKLGDPKLEKAITQKIDDLIANRIRSEHGLTSVDCDLSRRRLPFTAIIAMKNHGHPFASLTIELPEGYGTSARRIEADLGAPLERKTDPFGGGRKLMEYRTETKSYTAITTFTVDVRSEQVKRVMISVQRRMKR